MSLLGIDVGTTACKAAAVREDGTLIASASAEYAIQEPRPGWAELDAVGVWDQVQQVVSRVAAECEQDPPQALSVSSLGEAVVPVSADRRILGPSVLNFDVRGEEYLPQIGGGLSPEAFYGITGLTLTNALGMPKLLWVREHQPRLYEQTYRFLPWSSFVSFMLGADPVVDYSLASRLLCFEVEQGRWWRELLNRVGFDIDKLPATAPTGTAIGTVSDAVAARLGLPQGVAIMAGCHDQCANAVGSGAIAEGPAACGMGTYFCITPPFRTRRAPELMIERGLNTEHHAVPGQYVTFIYNQGGALLRWFRDTFAVLEHQRAEREGRDIYAELIAEVPAGPSEVMVLPHFVATGPPEFVADTAGVLAGLRLGTQRGDILKGLMEGVVFYLRACVENLSQTGIEIGEYRAAGGGSRSDVWLQICADIMGQPFTRVAQSEAGIVGCAVIAGVGSGKFSSYEDGVAAMVRLERSFAPDARQHERYQEHFARYRALWPLMRDYLRTLTTLSR
jgi:xylulokinase